MHLVSSLLQLAFFSAELRLMTEVEAHFVCILDADIPQGIKAASVDEGRWEILQHIKVLHARRASTPKLCEYHGIAFIPDYHSHVTRCRWDASSDIVIGEGEYPVRLKVHASIVLLTGLGVEWQPCLWVQEKLCALSHVERNPRRQKGEAALMFRRPSSRRRSDNAAVIFPPVIRLLTVVNGGKAKQPSLPALSPPPTTLLGFTPRFTPSGPCTQSMTAEY
jgi:hypothetical protein